MQAPESVLVGRVTAVYWPGQEVFATALAELADGAVTWPGLPAPWVAPMRLIVAPDKITFDSITRGRLPEWGIGVAIPRNNTIVLSADPQSRQTLQHELAHLALRSAVRRAPLWFQEGYASRAADEWGRLDALLVNWAVVWRRAPSLDRVNALLREGPSGAKAGYALATTAVLHLERIGGDRGLGPLIAALGSTSDLDRALRQAHGMSVDQFETDWRRDVRRRYGWLRVFTSFTVLWTITGLAVVGIWYRRRIRERERRIRLDDGLDLVEPSVTDDDTPSS